jgi:peptide/nickel transport system substrate-binding protein
MKKGVIWITFTGLMMLSMLLASCTTSTTAPAATSTTTTTITAPKTTSTSIATTTTSTIPTTTTSGNWWDKLGKPQYGGEMTIRIDKDITGFDPYQSGLMTIQSAYMERLFTDNWTTDPAVFDYSIPYRPAEFVSGFQAQSWEFTGPGVFVIHLRQGIHWQNIAPAFGREFVASDVIFHMERVQGVNGVGTTSLNANVAYRDVASVTAPDKYTVVMKWNVTNPEIILETMQAHGGDTCQENPEAVKQWGNLYDWHHAIGTGPFILKDFVSGSSATLTKDPNYWGYDERYPQNRLPYIDTLKVLIIPNLATTMAAFRTGKIDAIDGLLFQDVQTIQKTNAGVSRYANATYANTSVDMRNDKAPFTDIRVRKAMQMSIDLPTIAKTYYQGAIDPYPVALTSKTVVGWGFPYDQWPQDLKDEYAYNPTAAKKLLADAGYPAGFKTDIVIDNTSDLDLMQIIKSYFSAVGIDMDIRPMDPVTWQTFVRKNFSHDQMANRVNGSLGFNYEPTRDLLKFQVGYSNNYNMVNDPVFDKFYPAALAATSIEDTKKIVKQANEYVARQHYAISLLQPNSYAVSQTWLKGYNGQGDAMTGSGSGPNFLSFYLARFWIDQPLKKSMGY